MQQDLNDLDSENNHIHLAKCQYRNGQWDLLITLLYHLNQFP